MKQLKHWSPVSPSQRNYVYSHPLALWFSIGIAWAGAVNIFLPNLVEESFVSLALPDWLVIAFNAVWMIGGLCGAIGILRGRRNVEAAGMSLLSSGMFVYFIAALSIRSSAAVTGIFILTLAIGCALRARHLTQSGYYGRTQ